MKSFIVLLYFIIVPIISLGKNIGMSQVMEIASTFLKTNNCSIVKRSNSYCIVQRNNNSGFVIISTNDNSKKRIIGYSNSEWNEGGMPVVLTNWLYHLDRVDYDTPTLVRGEKPKSIHTSLQKVNILPLLKSHWHQSSPYNDLAPVIADGNVKTAAGCVAVAAAQIAYYWWKDNPDRTLKDTPVYSYGAAPVTYSIPKGSANEWNLIRNCYTKDDSPESKYAVAQLCYVIGTTSYLNYASSTGGSIYDVTNALKSQYNLLSEYVKKSKYDQQEWENLIYNELLNGRPVLCAGDGDGGHAFVLDGYDDTIDLYHFNFGWGGEGDGYFPIDDSEESMGGYFMDQSIVYNIHPLKRNISANINCSYASNNSSDINITVDVKNNSTLSIKQLRLYIVNEDYSLDKLGNASWLGEGVLNDNKMFSISFRIENPQSSGKTVFVLTDENKNVLTQTTFDVKSGINKVFNSDEDADVLYFSIGGERVNKPVKPGIYVKKSSSGIKKCVVK